MIHQVFTKIVFFFTSLSLLITSSTQLSAAESDNQVDLVRKIQEKLPGIYVIRENSVEINTNHEIGNGAFGKVYKGKWQEEVEECLVFKEININKARENLYGQGNKEVVPEDIEELVIWEAARSAQLNHPNIMEFEGICKKNQVFYLVAKFYPEKDLKRKLEQEVPLKQKIRWMIDITRGLAYLHHHGVLHRDLHAGNILIDNLNRARLGDFGIVQIDALIDKDSPVVVGMGVQSRRFKAPESVIDWSYSSKETDIYALGLVFWQLINDQKGANPQHTTWEWMRSFLLRDATLSKEDKNEIEKAKVIAPFRGISKGTKEKIENIFIQSSNLPQRESILPGYPEDLKELIHKCWSNDPRQRPSLQNIEVTLGDLLGKVTADFYVGVLRECLKLEECLEPKRESMRFYIPTKVFLENDDLTEKYTNARERLAYAYGYEGRDFYEILKEFVNKKDPSGLILLGDAGFGKTLTTYRIIDYFLNQWWNWLDFSKKKSPFPSHFPLLIRPRSINWSPRGLRSSIAELIENYAKNFKGIETSPLVLIDGYDECSYYDSELQTSENYFGWPDLESFSQAKIILTSRPSDLKRLKNQGHINQQPPRVFYILPLTQNDIGACIQRRQRFWNEISTRFYQEKIASNFKATKNYQDNRYYYHDNSLLLTLSNPLAFSFFTKNFQIFNEQMIHDYSLEKVGRDLDRQESFIRKQLYELMIDKAFQHYCTFLHQVGTPVLSNFTNKSLEEFKNFAAKVAAFETFKDGQMPEQFWPTDENIKEASSIKYNNQRNHNRSFLILDDYQALMLIEYHHVLEALPIHKRVIGYEFTHMSFTEYFTAYCFNTQKPKIVFDDGDFQDLGLWWARDILTTTPANAMHYNDPFDSDPWDYFLILEAFLSPNPKKILDLRDHQVTDHHAKAIAKYLQDEHTNQTLEYLDLRGTLISSYGVKMIVNAVKNNSHLMSFFFGPEAFSDNSRGVSSIRGTSVLLPLFTQGYFLPGFCLHMSLGGIAYTRSKDDRPNLKMISE